MRFTPQAIKALSLPPGKSEHWEWDPGLPCFGVRVRPGRKRYYVQYRWNGKSEKQSLGDPATVSLPQAREAARSILARVQLGEDPQPAKRAPQAPPALSLSSIAQQYLARSAKPRLRPRSFEEVERHLTRLWAPLGNMELDRLGLQNGRHSGWSQTMTPVLPKWWKTIGPRRDPHCPQIGGGGGSSSSPR